MGVGKRGWESAALPPAPAQQTTKWALVYFQRQLPEFVWDAAALEGNPYTFPEVKTLVEGTTVGGHKLSDEAEVQGLIHGSRELARPRCEHVVVEAALS